MFSCLQQSGFEAPGCEPHLKELVGGDQKRSAFDQRLEVSKTSNAAKETTRPTRQAGFPFA